MKVLIIVLVVVVVVVLVLLGLAMASRIVKQYERGVMLILGGLGLMHARRTSPATDILSGHPGPAPAPGTAPQQTTHSSGNGLPATVPGNSAGPSV